jgi:glycolate oxidase FAD binding subunit
MTLTTLERFEPRPGAARDEVLGMRPARVFAPASSEEAAALIGETAALGLDLAFLGGGTELGIGAAPEHLDAVVRSERLTKIVEHAPSDQIVVVEAGVTLAALQQSLAGFGQRLAIDPPLPELATIGGIVASNAFGPLRSRYGAIRDLIIGVSFVRADGALAKGGGKVVKNVAGFDLPKLMVGSLGTLGLITTATFRLHPLPEATSVLLLRNQSPAEVRTLVGELRTAQLEAAAVFALTGQNGLDVAVQFEGFDAGVQQQRDRFVTLVSHHGACDVLDQRTAQELTARHEKLRSTGSVRIKLAALPSAFERIAAEVLPPLFDALERPGLAWYPTLGLGFVSGDATDAEHIAAALAAARAMVVEQMRGSLVLAAAPPAVRNACSVWGEPPRAFGLMQSLKARLDPERRLAPGRFVGGI